MPFDKPVPPLTAPVLVPTAEVFPPPDLYGEAHKMSLVCNDALGRLCLWNMNPKMRRQWEVIG